jgi:ribosomal protein S18 acetylase RimI-like enzyme
MSKKPPTPEMKDRDLASIGFRPIRPDDEEFLFKVYARSRRDELAVLPWREDDKEAFLRMQFSAQHQYYQSHYPEAEFSIILLEDQPIGRLYVARWEKEIRIIDIALLPEQRNAGIGTRIMKDILSEAAKAKKRVRIHVEQNNPALRLYERLGFTRIEDRGIYYFMEWRRNVS